MALYYTAAFQSSTGVNRKWEIFGPSSPTPANLTEAGRGHTTVTWQATDEDEFATKMPSEMRVSFYDTAGGAVLTHMVAALSSDQDYAYTLKLTDVDTSEVLWLGFIETGAIERDEDGNLSMTLTATDGLKRLDDIYYTSDPTSLALYTGRVTVLALLVDLLDRRREDLTGHQLAQSQRGSLGDDLRQHRRLELLAAILRFRDRLATEIAQDARPQDRRASCTRRSADHR
jgi:hypothetical protein